MQDDNNESLSINTSDNEESDHFDKEVKVASNDFRIHGLEMLDNTMLRELHMAVTNATQEPMYYSSKYDPRINILKGNKSRKCLLSIDLENWIKAENNMLLQHFK